MRKRRWMELLKDYECEIHYHPRRANVVTDALSQKEKAILVNSGLMGIVIQFPGLIIKDKKEAEKSENLKCDGMVNYNNQLSENFRRIKTFTGRFWIPRCGKKNKNYC